MRRSCQIKTFLFISFSVFCFSSTQAQSTQSGSYDKGKVFVINAPVIDLKEFEQLVKQSLVLKPFGTVKVNISTLADKSFHEIPAGGSSWHEYASSNPTPSKFFPDKRIAPFIPANFVKKNRDLILAKAKILRENGLEAAFLGYEPNFLPAAFFEANPQMLGPRVDHPRRSTQKEYAPCVCVEETRDMFAGMMTELLKNVPEITMFGFKTNDAGAGVCWSDWLYSGANGNQACAPYTAGERMKLLLNAYKSGADKAGKNLSIYVDDKNSNYSDGEKTDIQKNLPENCYFASNKARNIVTLGSLLGSTYPITGLIDPLSLVNSVVDVKGSDDATVYINFRAAYDRGRENLETTQLTLNLIAELLGKPNTAKTLSGTNDLLKEISTKWGTEKNAEAIYEAFIAVNEAFKYKSATIPRVSSLYWGVTMRLVNRPLVFNVDKLTKEEESYFLPYIFNTSEQEARKDYMDLHGGRIEVAAGATENFGQRLNKAAGMLEKIDASAPGKAMLTKMAIGFRMYASFIKSAGNFAAAQDILDRNYAVFSSPLPVHTKQFSWEGHADYIPFIKITRDEYDNTQDLIQLMDKGGRNMLITARDQSYEDAFILSPDFYNQLKKKRKIMWARWQDIEKYLAPPLK